MHADGLRAGIRAGAVAGVLSGAPSTLHALMKRRPPLDAVRAAGTLLLPDDAPPRYLLVAGVVAHGALSLGWGVALAALLPRRHAAGWGAAAGLLIAGIDLGVFGRRWPRIRALAALPQIVDHVVYGALVGSVLSRTARS